jgi:DNA polymerase-4
MQRLIFHVDVNSAYLSWEAARRLAGGEPDLRLVPSAVGGEKDKRTGIILAKSIPAKRRGVRTGEPVAMALRKCPELVLVPPDFRLYQKCSAAFIDICRKYAPVVEQFSIDECFLDMTGTERLYPDPIAIANRIRREIRDTLGFTVNIGIGKNKLLAKMASDFEKPDRVHTLFPEELAEKFYPLPVRELFTVGASTADRLEAFGIRTIGELSRIDREALSAMLGEKTGEHLSLFAKGIDHSPVEGAPREAKGYSISTTLEENVTTLTRANAILLSLCDSVASRMRGEGAQTSCVAVTIRSTDFQNRSRQRKLRVPTDITSEIYAEAASLFAELWDRRTPLRLLGVALTDVVHGENEQLSLFPDERRERERKKDRVTDAIRRRHGSSTIVRGTVYRSSVEVGRKHEAEQELLREEAERAASKKPKPPL